MFQQFKNIDSAFKHIRVFNVVFLVGCLVLSCYTIYRSTSSLQKGQQKVYILLNGKLMDALAVDRADSLAVEIRDHVKMFHYYFYTLQPDEEVNRKHLTSALYLADNSARQEFENLTENGYYFSIISGNISQQVQDYDSITVDINQYPYFFKYFGKLKIIRPTSITIRSLITQGYIRTTEISSRNPHGFLIEGWKVLDNLDLTVEKRAGNY
jgi:conjugative transposon TraK protein